MIANYIRHFNEVDYQNFVKSTNNFIMDDTGTLFKLIDVSQIETYQRRGFNIMNTSAGIARSCDTIDYFIYGEMRKGVELRTSHLKNILEGINYVGSEFF